MADLSARHSRRRWWCGRFAAVLCLCTTTFCNPDADVPMMADPLPASLLPARSLQCFEDGQVYSCCEGPYRLNPSGILAVPAGEVDGYCGGACVVETEDVLNCVASALDGFAFYNGASVEDVRYALRRGCSHTLRRGPDRITIHTPACMCSCSTSTVRCWPCWAAAGWKLITGSRACVRAGDFNDLEPHLGDYPDIYGDDDDQGSGGSKVTAPCKLPLAFLGGAWLFLVLLGP
ncbi:unnamed protein product [Urochloa decumbens]|uniref:DUF7731 domain-containing protein n=1 Tax=Urochloa decumbens TaxID=240449 RepID=A0ABC8XAL0_9POAL